MSIMCVNVIVEHDRILDMETFALLGGDIASIVWPSIVTCAGSVAAQVNLLLFGKIE